MFERGKVPADDSGYHLHPNDAGMQVMANAIPLSLFLEDGFARFRKLSCRYAEYLQDFCSRAMPDNSDIDRLTTDRV